LAIEAHVAYFIEKEGAVVGEFKFTFAFLMSICERPFFVAK
jgi:hypothetical protein